MILKINGNLKGSIIAPPSKSVAHRVLICAALANKPGKIVCDKLNEDIEATVMCLRALGANIEYADGEFTVIPIEKVAKEQILNCCESGSTLRFLLPVAAILGADAIFTGRGRLPERPLSPLYEQMVEHGVTMSENGKMPLECKGVLTGGEYTLAANISSQFISGLLLALPLADRDSNIIFTGEVQSESYINITIGSLKIFGIDVERTKNGLKIPGRQKFLSPGTINIEGDWSAASSWIVAGTIGNNPIKCKNLDYTNSYQGDKKCVDALRKMGAEIVVGENFVLSKPSELHGAIIDCADTPDLVPALSIAAACAKGETKFINIERLRIKESDRIAAIQSILDNFKITSKADNNTLTIVGGELQGAIINPSYDHRIAMAAAIASSVTKNDVTIVDAECVNKSYPHFYDDFSLLGGNITVLDNNMNNYNINIEDLRKKIDDIDDSICQLFVKRMDVVDKVGEYKRIRNLPVNNSSREREVLTRISKALPSHLEEFGRSLYRSIFDISKAYEAMHKEKESPLYQELSKLIYADPISFPKRATVACQGCEGSYSQYAAERLFEIPEIMFNNSFEGVIRMLNNGLCEYGMLPIENSTAGSVNEIYDLLVKYNVYIVRSIRIKVDHLLLGAKGMKMSNLKTIYSHPQAISQCSRYLGSLKDVQVLPCDNTATAAMQVAKDRSKTSASISSRNCVELYDMDILAENIQNYDSNYTRFICISKEAKIYPGANRTSIMMVVPHKPGTLFRVLSRFNSIGVNLVKLESRPIPNRDFEFVFYFDIEISIYNDKFASLISELDHCEEQFKYFGTYSEII